MLFAKSHVFGTFKGFNERGLEFAAEIVAPYDADMLDRPQLGQFLLIELGSLEEAALGRITRFVPSGLLAGPEGEDYINNMQRRDQRVPEELKEQRLKYRVQIKLLGAVKMHDGKIIYVPSQRRLPHLGAKVALPSADVLKSLCSLSRGDTVLGDYVLGEFVYCGAKPSPARPEMRLIDPALPVTFNINNLVSRRSAVFARAGYGKSNLIKFLVGELYRQPPKTEHGRSVGTLIFDADGEYFWPDVVRGRPGLCDVPQLRDKFVLFTNRPAPSRYYGAWKVGEVKLDIRDLPARDVIGVAVSPERQEQQNVLKLKGLSESNWREMVDLIAKDGYQVTDADMGRLMGYTPGQVQGALAEIAAARSNMNGVIKLLHDPDSSLLSGTLKALEQGFVVVVDISLLSSAAGKVLAGLLMRKIFSHNQENFTGGAPIIPCIVILEEAQSVLGRRLEESSPFVEWVKEGRKYELGAILITQQPGSMAAELLSQADNWFCFHLLSEGDAGVLGKFNSHFSDDVLAHLIGEPISGNCYMWSAPHQPFVLPVRVRDFEALYRGEVRAGADEEPAGESRAGSLKKEADGAVVRLKDGLLQDLRAGKLKFVSIPPTNGGGTEMIGVYSGQLYHIIKALKKPTDTKSEDALKPILLKMILGLDEVPKATHVNKEYYIASREHWETALGQSLKL
jgi:uncharacterized protein